MQEAQTSVEFRGYCTQCKCGFSLPRGPKIKCNSGHELAKDFPHDNFWNYCCGCDAFYPSNGLAGTEDESNCLHCDRRINQRFFCNNCNVITVEPRNMEARRRPVELSEGGCPFPWCPGCLLPPSPSNLLTHDCYSLFVTFLTERKFCPFCNEAVAAPVRIEQDSEETLVTVRSDRTKTFAFFESFAKPDTPWWDLRPYLPTSKKGWRKLWTIVGLSFTIIGALIGLFPQIPSAIAWRINKALKHPLNVSSIECPTHFVLAGDRLRLTAKAKAPFETVQFYWTTTAGDIKNYKEHNGESEIELDTAGITVVSVPKEVLLSLTVVDEYGETVQRHERITILPRRLANNPPVLKIPPRCNCTLQEVVAGESVSLYAMAEDENVGEVLHYEWQSSSPSAQLIPITSAAGSSVILNTAGVNPRVAAVPLKIYLRVRDSNGGEVMDDITINVLPRASAGSRTESTSNAPPPNHAPKFEAFGADKTSIQPGEPVRLWAFVTDADGDSPLYYDWRASAGDIQNKNETAILTTTGINTSEIIIFLTVGDGRGGRTSQRLFVKVRDLPAPAASPSPSPVSENSNDDH